MRVLSVVGNRPQFVKSAPLSEAVRTIGIDEVVLHTGQHYDPELSEVFFEELGLAEPAYTLETGSASHARQTASMLPGVEDAILAERPDVVLVYGDTNSTLAGALAAAKLHVPVAHVEAGLRSFDRRMPEEVNRVVVDAISSALFAPSDLAVANLRREGIVEGVRQVGDVMADASRRLAPLARQRSSALADVGVEPGRYVVLTLHRPSNTTDGPLREVAEGLAALGEPVVFPVHPRTRVALAAASVELPEHVRVLPPLGYLDFAALASQARVIATDSGGLQKEAYWYGVPCVTLRDTSEWVETIEAGWNRLVPTEAAALVAALADPPRGAERPELYGDGHAAARIAEHLGTMGRR